MHAVAPKYYMRRKWQSIQRLLYWPEAADMSLRSAAESTETANLNWLSLTGRCHFPALPSKSAMTVRLRQACLT